MMVDMETEYLNFVCNVILVEELQEAVKVLESMVFPSAAVFPFVTDVRRNGLSLICWLP
jgi:hypothetical protein